MYLPGSYLVYPTPIHLHPFPAPPPPGAPAGGQPMRPAGLSPTPSVQSRDLKFGVERILSGEVSRPARASSPRSEGRCCRAVGGSPPPPVSPRSEGSSQHSSSTTTTPLPDAPGNGGSSPPAPYQSLSPPASRPLVVVPRGLLACTGDAPTAYHHHPPLPSPFAAPPSSPVSSPYPRPEDPLGPAQGGHRLAAATGAPTYAAYAAAGLYLHHHRHQHHPAAAVLQYPPPLYPQGGGGGGLVLGAGRGHHHVEEAAAPIGGGATCIIPVSSGGGSGGGAGGGGKRKRSWSRAVFSNLQRKGLEKRFQLQKYITKPDRRQLAATLGLTDAQVKVWFQNRRMKWRHSKEGKQQQQVVVVTTEPSLVPPLPPSPLHMLSSHQDSEQGDHSPSTVTDTGFGPPEWEGQESRSTDRPDSTQKGLEEEEIQVDS